MECEVEIMEPNSFSTGAFTSQKSNPRPLRSEAKHEDHFPCPESAHGKDAIICNCNEKELVFYLKDAVERKDVEFVVQTLVWYRKSLEAMKEGLEKLRRQLSAEGRKYDQLKRDNEECLKREIECQTQLDQVREHYEGLLSTHGQTQTEVHDLKKKFKVVSARDHNAQGILHVSKGIFMEETEGSESENSGRQVMRGCETPETDTNLNSPSMKAATPKPLYKSEQAAKEGSGGDSNKAKRTLNFSKEGCSVAATQDSTMPSSDQQGRNRGNVGVGLENTNTFKLSVHFPALNSGEESSGVCRNLYSENLMLKALTPGGVKVDELRKDDKERNIIAHLHAEQHKQSDPIDIAKDNENAWHEGMAEVVSCLEATPTNLGSSCHPSTDKSSKDRLQCSFPAAKTEMDGILCLQIHNPIVISDSESESSASPLRKKIVLPCSQKASCTPKSLAAEVETRNTMNIAGSTSDGEHSDHNKGLLMQRSAKTKRGHGAVVISESSGAEFSCKRRKSSKLDLRTQGISATECVDMKKESMMMCIKGNGQYETYPKEDDAVRAIHEPYIGSRSDRSLGKEDSLSNEDAEGVSEVKFRRIRRVKDISQLDEHYKEQTYPTEGDPASVTDFRNPQEVNERSELLNARQHEQGMCLIDRAPVAKYRRLKSVLEASGPEKSKVGKEFAGMQKQNISDPDVNDLQNNAICSDSRKYKAYVGGSTSGRACKEKSAGDGKHAEGLSEPSIYTLNSRTQSNRSRKMINLMKESDGEDDDYEDENDSQVEDLGGFIVDSSKSGTYSECSSKLKGNISDSGNSVENLDSEADIVSSSEEDLHEVIRKISRQSKNTLDWNYEGDMLAAFAKDPVLCMRAVCALYRQQTNEEKSGKSSLYLNRCGFDKTHALRGSLLAEFLTENDPFGPMIKSVEELRRHDSKGVKYCTNLAIHHSKQLFEIFKINEDPHFPHR